MDTRTSLMLWFTFGVALQVLALVAHRMSWSKLGICLAVAAAVGLAGGRSEGPSNVYFHWFAYLAVFAVMFAISFSDEILQFINERILLSYTLIFWYIYCDDLSPGSEFQSLLRLAILPSAAALYAAWTDSQPGFLLRLVLYTWFLVVTVAIGVAHFSPGQIQLLLSDRDTSWLLPLDCVLTGMAALYLTVNCTYLFLLIPIPGRGQSMRNRMQEWRELTQAMTRRMGGDQVTGWLGLILLTTEAAILVMNYRYRLIPDTLLVNGLILLPILFSLTTNDAIRLEFRSTRTKKWRDL